MDSSLTHLPPRKQDDLRRIVALIHDHCPAVGMIILFGSYARGDWTDAQELAPDRRSGHASDYDLLAVTSTAGDCDARVWRSVEQACAESGLSAHPRVIHHDIGYLNRQLEKGQYFFSDVVGEGKLLFDAGEFTLASARVLSAKERLEAARRDFEHWFKRAEQFWGHYQLDRSNGWLEMGAFNLHQTSEACYKTSLLIFTGYIPDEHYLYILGRLVSDVDPAFTGIFPMTDAFQSEAFTLLDNAYIGARYHKDYTIDERTLDYLAGRVAALMTLTRERCEAKMEALARAAA